MNKFGVFLQYPLELLTTFWFVYSGIITIVCPFKLTTNWKKNSWKVDWVIGKQKKYTYLKPNILHFFKLLKVEFTSSDWYDLNKIYQ